MNKERRRRRHRVDAIEGNFEGCRDILVSLFAEADMTIADLEKELDQSRSAHRCVLHLPGVGRITVPASILFARENRFPSTHNLAGGIITK
jgi:hypothetical protein